MSVREGGIPDERLRITRPNRRGSLSTDKHLEVVQLIEILDRLVVHSIDQFLIVVLGDVVCATGSSSLSETVDSFDLVSFLSQNDIFVFVLHLLHDSVQSCVDDLKGERRLKVGLEVSVLFVGVHQLFLLKLLLSTPLLLGLVCFAAENSIKLLSENEVEKGVCHNEDKDKHSIRELDQLEDVELHPRVFVHRLSKLRIGIGEEVDNVPAYRRHVGDNEDKHEPHLASDH